LASSREGEELAFLKAYRRWLDHLNSQTNPTNPTNPMLSVIVPRHPERFDEIANLIESQGFVLHRASQVDWNVFQCFHQIDKPVVILGDDMGRMAFWYALSDVVLMGGSWENFGGQNLIEPLQQGKPVWLGLHTHNFSEVSRKASEAGVVFVCGLSEGQFEQNGTEYNSEQAMFEAIGQIAQNRLLLDPAYQAKVARFIDLYKGGTKRLVKVIRLVLEL
jgi:3-deoxy-D-manno-octulosonic-acid transferase